MHESLVKEKIKNSFSIWCMFSYIENAITR